MKKGTPDICPNCLGYVEGAVLMATTGIPDDGTGRPAENRGVCDWCGKWWRQNEFGAFIPYDPSVQDLTALAESIIQRHLEERQN